MAPILIIIAILAVVGLLGFGTSSGTSKQQVQREVTQLLSGIPQRGTGLGSPKAPITVRVYADVECPTVKLFVENYLPSIIDTWVRTGVVRLDYRSLETDTVDEEMFFKQEIAALAAGRQDSMWNFLLTFVRQQGDARTGYVTEDFLAGIASQVPGLNLASWRRDRANARLSRQVALGVYSGHTRGLLSTPSLLIGFSEGAVDRRADRVRLREEVQADLDRVVGFLREEESEAGDSPVIRTVESNVAGG